MSTNSHRAWKINVGELFDLKTISVPTINLTQPQPVGAVSARSFSEKQKRISTFFIFVYICTTNGNTNNSSFIISWSLRKRYNLWITGWDTQFPRNPTPNSSTVDSRSMRLSFWLEVFVFHVIKRTAISHGKTVAGLGLYRFSSQIFVNFK